MCDTPVILASQRLLQKKHTECGASLGNMKRPFLTSPPPCPENKTTQPQQNNPALNDPHKLRVGYPRICSKCVWGGENNTPDTQATLTKSLNWWSTAVFTFSDLRAPQGQQATEVSLQAPENSPRIILARKKFLKFKEREKNKKAKKKRKKKGKKEEKACRLPTAVFRGGGQRSSEADRSPSGASSWLPG